MTWPTDRQKPSLHAAHKLQKRADDYRAFIPEWPALSQSLEREAKQMLADLAPKAAS